MTDGSAAGAIYAQVITKQLEREEERKTSLEQRGLAVISTSGVLVSLLLAITAVQNRNSSAATEVLVRIPLIVALVGFTLAAAFAVAVNVPRSYATLSTEELARMTTEQLWNGAPEGAARRVAESQVRETERARRVNLQKHGSSCGQSYGRCSGSPRPHLVS